MPTDNILDKLKKKYPALQEEPLMDDLSKELNPEEDLGHPDMSEDLGDEQDNPDEPASEASADEDMGFLSNDGKKPTLPMKKFPPKK